jgi:nucleoside-diphosphate-sugar epimerase
MMRYKGEYVNAPTYPGSVSRRCPDISKSQTILDYSPKVSWKEGLEKAILWYTNFYKSGAPIHSGGFKPPDELSYQDE